MYLKSKQPYKIELPATFVSVQDSFGAFPQGMDSNELRRQDVVYL